MTAVPCREQAYQGAAARLSYLNGRFVDNLPLAVRRPTYARLSEVLYQWRVG
jgi:hypothetical protein